MINQFLEFLENSYTAYQAAENAHVFGENGFRTLAKRTIGSSKKTAVTLSKGTEAAS
ncbi:MAG: hypothetical protein ACLRSW_04565 [Christensenellaceae bacterium]